MRPPGGYHRLGPGQRVAHRPSSLARVCMCVLILHVMLMLVVIGALAGARVGPCMCFVWYCCHVCCGHAWCRGVRGKGVKGIA